MRRLVLVLAGMLALASAVWWVALRATDDAEQFRIPGTGHRMTVEVLNATRIDGLARSVTRKLRRRGIDVVYFGTATMDTLNSTLIVVRRGDTTAATRVRDALGTGQVVLEPDPRLLLDASVILGADAQMAQHHRP